MQDLFNPPETPSQDATAVSDTIGRVLEALRLVDAPPEEAFDKFTRLISRVLEVPVSIVSFVEEDKDRQFFKSQVGLAEKWAQARQTPLTHSFCQYVKKQNRPLVIESAPDDSLVCDNLAIPDLGVRAYLGVPIHGPGDEPLGALAAIDTTRRTWTDADLVTMVELASCVSDQIKLRAALLNG